MPLGIFLLKNLLSVKNAQTRKTMESSVPIALTVLRWPFYTASFLLCAAQLSLRACIYDMLRHMRILFEVFNETCGKLFCSGVVFVFICPSVARVQNLCRNVGAGLGNIYVKDRIKIIAGLLQLAWSVPPLPLLWCISGSCACLRRRNLPTNRC